MAGKQLPRAVVDLEDYTESKNVLIYGDSGVGKTALLAMDDTLILAPPSEGTVTIKRFRKAHGLPALKNVKVWPIRAWKDFEDAYLWLAEQLEKGTCPFKHVLIDSLTSAQQKALRAILKHAVETSRKPRDPDIPSIDNHQKWQNMLKRYVTDFNELPIDVFWTAQAMRREDEEGEPLVLPLILGKDFEIAAWVCAQMHCIAYYGVAVENEDDDGENGQVVRRLLWEHIPPWFAKDRYGVFGRWTDIARDHEQLVTWDKLIDAIDADPEAVARAAKARNKEVQRTSLDRFTEPAKDKSKKASKGKDSKSKKFKAADKD